MTGYAALLFALGWLAVLWAARGWVRRAGDARPQDAVPGGPGPAAPARADGLAPRLRRFTWWNVPARYAGWLLTYFGAAVGFLLLPHRSGPDTWGPPTEGRGAGIFWTATAVLTLIGALLGLASASVPEERVRAQAWTPGVASRRLAALAVPLLLDTPLLAGWVNQATVLMELAGSVWLLAVPIWQQARHMPAIPESD